MSKEVPQEVYGLKEGKKDFDAHEREEKERKKRQKEHHEKFCSAIVTGKQFPSHDHMRYPPAHTSKSKALKKKTFHGRPKSELDKEQGVGKYKGRYA